MYAIEAQLKSLLNIESSYFRSLMKQMTISLISFIRFRDAIIKMKIKINDNIVYQFFVVNIEGLEKKINLVGLNFLCVEHMFLKS